MTEMQNVPEIKINCEITIRLSDLNCDSLADWEALSETEQEELIKQEIAGLPHKAMLIYDYC